MRQRYVLTFLVLILVLFACNKTVVTEPIVKPDPVTNTKIPDKKDPVETITQISLPNLTTEKGIKEYLMGEWFFKDEYKSNILVNMSIDTGLNVILSFYDFENNEDKGEYTGKMELDRIYPEEDEAPDLIVINLDDPDEYGGDFFFTHRTSYDGRFVMSLFFAANGNCIFDMLGPEGYENVPEEIVFERLTEGVTKEVQHKNKEFHAIYWGMSADQESLWLDDVVWSQEDNDDYATMYPSRMNWYKNDIQESVLYDVAKTEISEIFGDDLTKGGVYFVKTDDKGVITNFIDGERKLFTEGKWIDENEIEDIYQVFKRDVDVIKKYIEMGMTMENEAEMILIDGEWLYVVYLGTQHEDYFTRELTYAINNKNLDVYYYDVINDVWEYQD